MVNPKRVTLLNKASLEPKGPIIYWMSRDQRVKDNWALLYALEISKKYNLPISVVFCLNTKFLEATIRQYDFMIKGLQEVDEELDSKNISFFLLEGSPESVLPKFVKKHDVSAVVTDFSPIRIGRKWRESLAKELDIPLFEVDAHNVVPCLIASNKQEYGAYTLRPKIHKLLNEFLEDYPSVPNKNNTIKKEKIEWKNVFRSLDINFEVKPVDWIIPGYSEGMKLTHKFIQENLKNYDTDRNDPTKNGQSNLSPYLHFGQISSQRVALEAMKENHSKNRDAFLEELIVRKELADNFCYFNQEYDKFSGFPNWAQKSLNEHAKDKREYIYTKHELEFAKTHDPLWNASQLELTQTGKMHGYLRMYWAKKILEWTKDPQTAQDIAIYLNDKYELDGRDPNGYTGIAWSIGGVHDRAWFKRPIFGNIRYMSFNGAKTKFDIEKYIQKFKK